MNSAFKYIKGLFQTQSGKRNIERINEVVPGSVYENAQYFISESPWDYRVVMNQMASEGSELFENSELVGLLIDESGNAKQGSDSVGVARQYCGQIGKIDNCQVAVFAALSVNPYYTIIDTELYLPEEWTEDPQRCKKAGVPKKRFTHKTKTELALDIIKRQKSLNTRFDWVGGDGFYGNDYKLAKSLDEMGQTFVFEVHRNQMIYTENPVIEVPQKTSLRGRKPTKLTSNIKPIEVRNLDISVGGKGWKQMTIRKSSTGVIKAQVWIQKVYVWDHKENKARVRQLIMRKTRDKKGKEETKYALTNSVDGKFSDLQLVKMLSERYFVERAFQDAKQEIGMSDYQVRGWLAWHHHIALVMMAMMFLVREKIIFSVDRPLLSAYDIRQIMIETYSRKATTREEIDKQIQYRHKQRLASQRINI